MSIPKVGPVTQPITSMPCSVCHQTVEKVKKCGRCLHVFYCSQECQRKDWPAHKPKCIPEEKRIERIETSYENLGLENKNRDWIAMGTKLVVEKLSISENSPDMEILFNMLKGTWSVYQTRKPLVKLWKKQLSPEDFESRCKKFDEVVEQLNEMSQQRRNKSNSAEQIPIIIASVEPIITQPKNIPSNIVKAAKTLHQFLPLMRACPDVELIFNFCSMGVSQIILEENLNFEWAKLPPEEMEARKQAWQNFASHYEACYEALKIFLTKKPSSSP